MTSTDHSFWFYNWGNFASVIGAVLSLIGIGVSIWTLQTAKSAERAAIEAKNDAANHSFVNDARRAETYVREVVSHLRNNRFGDAVYRSSDLRTLISELNEILPKRIVGAELQAHMVGARDDSDQLDKLIRKINGDLQTPSVKEVERIINRANSIHAVIVKVRIAVATE